MAQLHHFRAASLFLLWPIWISFLKATCTGNCIFMEGIGSVNGNQAGGSNHRKAFTWKCSWYFQLCDKSNCVVTLISEARKYLKWFRFEQWVTWLSKISLGPIMEMPKTQGPVVLNPLCFFQHFSWCFWQYSFSLYHVRSILGGKTVLPQLCHAL